MKTKILLLSLLALVFEAGASSVSSEQAVRAVRTFTRRGQVLGVPLGRTVDTSRVRAVEISRNGQAVGKFYEVPLVGGGRVYTSGDTDGEPILAFTENSSGELSEKSPLYALLEYSLAVRKYYGVGVAASNQWVKMTSASPVAEGEEASQVINDMRVMPLLKTQWSQSTHNGEDDGYPCYNYYTPVMTNENGKEVRGYSGCTATAAAQVMRYFQYPDQLSKQYEFDCIVAGVTNTYATKGGPYDWNNMMDTPKSATINYEDKFAAIGMLMYDIGIALNSTYDFDGTSAAPYDIAKMYVNTFGYANAYSYWDDHSYYTGSGGLHIRSTCERVVLANLDAGKPVQLGIYGYAKDKFGNLTSSWAGHSVVADGYGFSDSVSDGSAYVHVNLGWNGSDDAWYNLPEIDTAAAGAKAGDSSGYDFLYLGSATFNIGVNDFEKDKEIVSGRLTDDDGNAFTDATVYVMDKTGAPMTVLNAEGSEVTELRPNANGIFHFYVDGATNCDLKAVSDDADLFGFVDQAFKVTKTTAGANLVVSNSTNVGNYWGADLTMTTPKARTNGEYYPNLYRALLAATNEVENVVEILEAITLQHDVEISVPVTLVTTDGVDPYEAKVTRKNGAKVTVKAGGLLSLSNVVFMTANTTPIKTEAGGKVAVAGIVVLDDIVSEVPGIVTADKEGFVLAGELTTGITVECTAATANGQQFGVYTCDYAVASACANLLVSYRGVDRAGKAVSSDGSLVWQDNSTVRPEVAVNQKAGEEEYYRSLDRFYAKYPNGASTVLLRSGAKLNKAVTLTGTQTVKAKDGLGLAKIYPGSAAGFTLDAAADIAFTSVGFDGYVGNAMFQVPGGAKLALNSCAFTDIEGTNIYSGAVQVRGAGAKVMATDTVFDNCRATGRHKKFNVLTCAYEETTLNLTCGGAVYLYGKGSELKLIGGEIKNCSAKTYGGGIYGDAQTKISVSGNLTVKNNVSGSENNQKADDIFLAKSSTVAKNCTLELAGAITSGKDAIGVRYTSLGTAANPYGTNTNDLFAVVAGGASSASSFFNDCNVDGTTGEVTADGQNLCWVGRTAGDNKIDPADDESMKQAIVKVTKDGEVAYYGNLVYAFDWADQKSTVELLKNATFDEDLTVKAEVTFDGAGYVLSRAGDVSINVDSGATLAVTNITVNGAHLEGTIGMFCVDGGTLRLENGALVGGVVGDDSRAAGAVVAWNGAIFIMNSGAEISDSVNNLVDPGSQAGHGGGVLLDNAIAYLRGGKITGCYANRGGGVYAGSESKVYVSGDFTAIDNKRVNKNILDNLYLSEDSTLYLDGELTGWVGVSQGIASASDGEQPVTNVFGQVAEEFAQATAVAATSASHFRRDVSGLKIAGKVDADNLLVWDFDNEVPAPEVNPTPTPEPEPEVIEPYRPIGFNSISRISENEWRVVFTNCRANCDYCLISTDDLSKGFVNTSKWVTATADGPMTNTVPCTGANVFWRALGRGPASK